MNVSTLHKKCTYRFHVKSNLSEVGVGQILNMEVHDFCAVVKHGVKSWVAHGVGLP